IVPIICKTATFIFLGANILVTQCGETIDPTALDIKIPNKAPKPNVPKGVIIEPFGILSPPIFVGEVVVAIASTIFCNPPVETNTKLPPKNTPITTKIVLIVSVAATDQNPPILVNLRKNQNAKIAYS